MPSDSITAEGVITEMHHSRLYRVLVRLGNRDHAVLAHPCGKIHQGKIKLVPGDRVDVSISPYDLSRGIITYRKK